MEQKVRPSSYGVMLALMEPTPDNEEEFNDWYDTEHLPERAATEGFLTAGRLVCVEGWPRYGALYDLRSPNTLREPAYLAYTGENLSPWSRRIRRKRRGSTRWVGSQLYPGNALTGGAGAATRLVVMRFSGKELTGEQAWSGLTEAHAAKRETIQTRLFVSESGDEYLGIVESRSHRAGSGLEFATLGEAAAHVTLANVYVPYGRREQPV